MFSHISKLQKWTQQGFSHIPFGGKKITRFFYGIPGAGAGVQNRVDFSSVINLDGAFTVSFWGFIMDQVTATDSNLGICGHQLNYTLNTPTPATDGGRITWSGNTLRLDTNTVVSGNTISTSAVNLEDTFAFYEIKRAASTNVVTLYRNKVSVGTATVAGRIPVNRVLGNPDGSGFYGWAGGIREFKIHSRELISGESDILYAGGHVSTNCELWYKFNEQSGTVITDYSGNGRTGTLVNGAATIYDSYKGNTFNLLQNSGFTLWTGTPDAAIPNNFSRSGTYSAGVNYLLDVSGKMQLVTTDGSLCGISKTVHTVGKRYRARVYVHTKVGGGVYVYDGVNPANAQNTTTTVGLFKYDYPAAGTSIGLFRSLNGFSNNVTISHFSLSEI